MLEETAEGGDAESEQSLRSRLLRFKTFASKSCEGDIKVVYSIIINRLELIKFN